MLTTIRARVTEAVDTEGNGYPKTVTVTGAASLSDGTVREIAQNAVDNMYGEYESGYRAVFNVFDQREAERNGTADAVTVKVEKIALY